MSLSNSMVSKNVALLLYFVIGGFRSSYSLLAVKTFNREIEDSLEERLENNLKHLKKMG